MLADRILAEEILPCKGVADNYLFLSVQPRSSIKSFSPQERNPKNRKIPRSGPPDERRLTLPPRQSRMLHDRETAVPARALAPHHSNKSGPLATRPAPYDRKQRL